MINVIVVPFLVLLSLSAQISVVFAQESLYRRVNVGGCLSVEVPSHWHIRDLDERLNIATSGEAISDTVMPDEPMHVSALSVVSKPAPVGAIIRVSFIPTNAPDEYLSQSDVEPYFKTDSEAKINELENASQYVMTALAKGLETNGMKMLDQSPSNIERVGGLFAITYTYRRTSAYGQTPFLVTQYHIPLGGEKVLISLSYREVDAPLFRPILDRVKRSIIIKSTNMANATSINKLDLEVLIITLEETEKLISKSLPKNLDDITVLESVEATGVTLTYYYKVNKTYNDQDKSLFSPTIKAFHVNTVCNSKPFLDILKLGANFTHKYIDKNNQIFANININLNDCVNKCIGD